MAGRGHVPVRMCAGCGGRFAKASLVRFTVLKQSSGQTVVLDFSGSPGRGAYTCLNPECLKRAIKKRTLTGRLKAAAVSPSILEDYERLLKGDDYGKKKSLRNSKRK